MLCNTCEQSVSQGNVTRKLEKEVAKATRNKVICSHLHFIMQAFTVNQSVLIAPESSSYCYYMHLTRNYVDLVQRYITCQLCPFLRHIPPAIFHMNTLRIQMLNRSWFYITKCTG